jgi:hypothetical protein
MEEIVSRTAGRMTPRSIRIAAIIYLAVIAATSLPVTVGLLGWCPCGCIPDVLGPAGSTPDGERSESGDSHHHDSHHCRAGCATPYCPLLTEVCLAGSSDEVGQLVVEFEQHVPFTFHAPLIRPPRA